MSGQVYAVASGKGGVGKTTTVVNLGVSLRAAGHTVALVDADLGMPNLATVLGLSVDLTVHDVLADESTADEAVSEEAEGFAVLPGSPRLEHYASIDPTRLGDVIRTLADGYEYVLIDTGAGLSYEDVLPLGLVDGILLVTSPDQAAVQDTQRTVHVAGLLDGAVRGVVVTKAGRSTNAESIAAELGADLLGVVPEDAVVRESTAEGRPLEAYDPDSPAAGAYRRLAGVVTGESDEPARVDPSTDDAAVEPSDARREATGETDDEDPDRTPEGAVAGDSDAGGTDEVDTAAHAEDATDEPDDGPIDDDDAVEDGTEPDAVAETSEGDQETGTEADATSDRQPAAPGDDPAATSADRELDTGADGAEGDAPERRSDPDEEPIEAEAEVEGSSAGSSDDTDGPTAGDDGERGGFFSRLMRRFG